MEPFLVGERVFYFYPSTSPKKFYGRVMYARPYITLSSGEFKGWEYRIDFDGYGEHWYINMRDRKIIFPDEDTPHKPSWEV